MHTPKLTTAEPVVLFLAKEPEQYSFLLPVDHFPEGTPCIVEIPSGKITGLIEFTSLEQESSLTSDSSLGAKSNYQLETFWSKLGQEVDR